MIDKKQWEEIKNDITEINRLRDEDDSEWFNLLDLFFSEKLYLLVDQAKQVEKLMQRNIKIKKQKQKFMKNATWHRKEKQRYREALEFYAKEEIYEFETIVSDCDIEVESRVLDDYGKKARQALESEPE